MSTQTNTGRGSRPNVQKMVLMAVLIAILILMSFTPLGYLKTAGLEITFNLIPVAIGAVVLGPAAGAVLGGVFGLTSYFQCLGILGFSPFGATLNGINPVATVITCIVPRIICGFVPGLIFKLLSGRDKTKIVSHAVACLSCPLVNTVLFMTSIMVFFGSSDYISGMQGGLNPFVFVIMFVGINGLVELISCFVIATAVSKVLTVLNYKMSRAAA